jgi:hypothetical protein
MVWDTLGEDPCPEAGSFARSALARVAPSRDVAVSAVEPGVQMPRVLRRPRIRRPAECAGRARVMRLHDLRMHAVPV